MGFSRLFATLMLRCERSEPRSTSVATAPAAPSSEAQGFGKLSAEHLQDEAELTYALIQNRRGSRIRASSATNSA